MHDGANSVEVVVNVGELVANNFDLVRKEISESVNAAKMRALTEDGGDVAVLINVETAFSTREQQRRVCQIIAESRGDFVATNTGYAVRGVSIDDVMALREMADRDIGIKASGGIRTVEQARMLISAGSRSPWYQFGHSDRGKF